MTLDDGLDAVRVIQSLFCLPGECVVNEDVEALLDGCDGRATMKKLDYLGLRLNLNVQDEHDPSHSFTLDVGIPVDSSDGPFLDIHLQQPHWLHRRIHDKVCLALKQFAVQLHTEHGDDVVAQIMAAVQFIMDELRPYCNNDTACTTHGTNASSKISTQYIQQSDTFVSVAVHIILHDLSLAEQWCCRNDFSRVWMHLPSLSTRSKRADLVNYAPSYGITGVVCAGKPGVIIMEAASVDAIESYLSFIKTSSWADIPSSHKKISEKLRETDLKRSLGQACFSDMKEITDDVNAEGMKGVRKNRNDLSSLRQYLDQLGLGDRFQSLFSSSLAI